MEHKRKLGNEKDVVPLKQKKVNPTMETDNSTANSRTKQRRPWRNKVRRKAAKEAKRKLKNRNVAVQQCMTDTDTASTTVTSLSDNSQRRRKKKRKKRTKTNDPIPDDSGSTTIQEMNGIERLNSSLFRYINEQLYTMTGAEAAEMFRNDPYAFEIYHKGYQKQSKQWPYNPIYGIMQWIRRLTASDLVIADMGCGDAKIAESLSDIATVHSFDLAAANDRVTVCDMSKVPLERESVDIVVFCLSLMGTNLNEYIREANRLLKKGGFLKIAEVASRFSSVKQFVHAVTKMGFELNEKRVNGNGYFIMLEFIKKGKVEQKRPLGLKLKPCLYRKR